MSKTADLREKALAAIRNEKRVVSHFKPVMLKIAVDGTATVQVEVDNVAIKRLMLERLAATRRKARCVGSTAN